MSTLISMLVGSRLAKKSLVGASIRSILSNVGTTDFLLVVGISSHISQDIIDCVTKLKNSNIKVISDHCGSYADFNNHILLKYGTGTKWFLSVHDDVEIKTKDFVGAVECSTQPFLSKVGWITFTDVDYLNGHWAPCTRGGYHIDVVFKKSLERRKVHHFHNLEEGYWWKGSGHEYFSHLKYDFPRSAVRCHTPFSHCVMIETEKLRRLGPCENWSEVSLLTDEDWGLTALKQGMVNIWLPHIEYLHTRSDPNVTRAHPIIYEKGKQVVAAFVKKWGFTSKPLNIEDINKIKRMFAGTNIPWSCDRRSYDWEYMG